MTLIDEFTRSPPFGASANLTIPCHTGAAVRPRHSQFAIGRGGEFRDIPLQVRPRSTDRTRLRPQSPENGSFSNIRRRLSAILLRNRPNSVSGDPPLIHKSPLFAGLSGIFEGKVSRCWTGWLGREDSNLRMVESKSTALPLGDAPKAGLESGGTGLARIPLATPVYRGS
jgi:hypothetical protein